MTRQFFVGGNFKMNPASRDAKRALIKTLNEATLDPNTGKQKTPPSPPFSTSRFNRRGRHCTPGLVSDPYPGPFAQRRQGRGPELPL